MTPAEKIKAYLKQPRRDYQEGLALFQSYGNKPATAEMLMNKRSAVVIHPERIVSWDHNKLGGTY